MEILGEAVVAHKADGDITHKTDRHAFLIVSGQELTSQGQSRAELIASVPPNHLFDCYLDHDGPTGSEHFEKSTLKKQQRKTLGKTFHVLIQTFGV